MECESSLWENTIRRPCLCVLCDADSGRGAGRGVGRGRMRGFGRRGRGGRGGASQLPSRDQLDAELDAYNAKVYFLLSYGEIDQISTPVKEFVPHSERGSWAVFDRAIGVILGSSEF